MGQKLPKPACVSGNGEDGGAVTSQRLLFETGNPFRARSQWATKSMEGWYFVTPFKGCVEHLVIYDPAVARSILSGIEDGVQLWKTRKGSGVLDGLLGDALTSASPDDWRRCRPQVCTAIGEAPTFDQRFTPPGRAA
eukprot:Hpha_TRINITY_DN20500_c0_g1::TRINITY_DN20500_c0_g1_i1::g.30716::m.30716